MLACAQVGYVSVCGTGQRPKNDSYRPSTARVDAWVYVPDGSGQFAVLTA